MLFLAVGSFRFRNIATSLKPNRNSLIAVESHRSQWLLRKL
jgi:hypothetical protein